MANYTPSVDFAAKDDLPRGNAAKIISGTEINTEFLAIQTAVGTKANLADPSLEGTPTAPTASAGTNSRQIATTAFVQTASTTANISAGTIDNVSIGATTPATTLDVDNINIDGNTISSTDTVGDGNIAITPNGTGEVDISKVDIDGGAIDGTEIGGTSPAIVRGTVLKSSAIQTKASMSASDVVLVLDGEEIKKITQETLVNFTQASVQAGDTGWSPYNTYYSEAAAIAWAQGEADTNHPDNFNFQVATFRLTSGDREWIARGFYNYF